MASLLRTTRVTSNFSQFVSRVRVMMFNATFNNISVISWWIALYVEIPGIPGENHRTAASP